MRFEYPFNERVRNTLRLEFLLERMHLLAKQPDARMHQLALSGLFDVLDITERADVKSTLTQDLMRQRQTIVGYADHPHVNPHTFQKTLQDIDQCLENLNNLGRIGQAVRDNEWLVGIRGRLTVAGGAAHIDSPSLLAWQQRSESQRQADLSKWMLTVQPLRDAINMTLGLLRQSCEPEQAVAKAGSFQRSLEGKSFHILQVWVDVKQNIYPEMSGNKYMMWIRFSELDQHLKTHSVSQDVSFKYALCGL